MGVVLFGLVGYAVIRDWAQVRHTIAQISPLELVLSESLALVGLGASVLVWRFCLLELGSGVRSADAAKIYLVGQLGKYVPGSFWAFLVQMELASRVGVARSRALAASVIAAGVNVVTGLVIGVVLIPSAGDGRWWHYAAFVGLAMVGTLALTPPVLTRFVDLGLRMLKRGPLEAPITWVGMRRATGWSLATWLAYGLSVWVLAIGVGAPAGESFLLCLGGTPWP